MKKAELTNGTKVFVLNIQQFVSASVFAVSLRNEFYTEIAEKLEVILNNYAYLRVENTELFDESLNNMFLECDFIEKMTKKKAEELLRLNLKMYGKEGSIEDEMYSSSYERGEALNRCYQIALEWVKKNYPYLSN
jgi:hypothetical protein